MMNALDKIDICDRATELLTRINNCDDWYFADFVMDVLSSGNIRAIDEAKSAILLTLN